MVLYAFFMIFLREDYWIMRQVFTCIFFFLISLWSKYFSFFKIIIFRDETCKLAS